MSEKIVPALVAKEVVTSRECENCQKYLCEKIDSLRREVKLLLGTTSLTIVLSAISLYLESIK